MKKIICFTLIGLAVISGIVVLASYTGNFIMDADTDINTERQKTESIYTIYNKTPVYDKKLRDANENRIFEKLDKSGKSKNAIYDDIYAYKRFKKVYRPDMAELAYIDSLIDLGADVKTLIDIYVFWETTTTEISTIGNIYDLSKEIQTAFWIEEAFNQLTDNVHGVLDYEDVQYYINAGLLKGDISIANILSRRGVFTITEILNMLTGGANWGSILYQINAVSPLSTKSATLEKSIFMDDKISQNPGGFLACIQMADFMDKDPMDYLETENYVETCDTDMKKFDDTINNLVHLELAAEGIVTRERIPNEAIESIKPEIIANGLSDNQIEQYLDEGYGILDILNASEQSRNTEKNVGEILTNQRNELFSSMGVNKQ